MPMENNHLINNFVTVLMTIVLLVVSYFDVKTKKIKNYWSILNLALATILIIINNSFSIELFVLPLGILVVGFFLFAIKLMGAGDVKFLTTLILIIPLEHHHFFIQSFILSLLLYSIILFFVKLTIYRNDFKLYWRSGQHLLGVIFLIQKKEAFAPCILLAWIIYLVQIGK
jgi:prepilin peptidase CpaA